MLNYFETVNDRKVGKSRIVDSINVRFKKIEVCIITIQKQKSTELSEVEMYLTGFYVKKIDQKSLYKIFLLKKLKRTDYFRNSVFLQNQA